MIVCTKRNFNLIIFIYQDRAVVTSRTLSPEANVILFTARERIKSLREEYRKRELQYNDMISQKDPRTEEINSFMVDWQAHGKVYSSYGSICIIIFPPIIKQNEYEAMKTVLSLLQPHDRRSELAQLCENFAGSNIDGGYLPAYVLPKHFIACETWKRITVSVCDIFFLKKHLVLRN